MLDNSFKNYLLSLPSSDCLASLAEVRNLLFILSYVDAWLEFLSISSIVFNGFKSVDLLVVVPGSISIFSSLYDLLFREASAGDDRHANIMNIIRNRPA